MPTALQDAPPTVSRRPWRRGLLLGAVLAAVCVGLWVLSDVLVDGSDRHGGAEVRQLDPSVAAEQGIGGALADLHGHLNWVVWGRGDLEESEFLGILDETVIALEDEDEDLAAELATVRTMVTDEDRDLVAVHGLVERIEDRYAALPAR